MASLLTILRVLQQRRAQERACSWSRAQLERHQQERLTDLRRHAVQSSPFYRRFHAGLEGAPLSELPILTKAMLMQHFDELVTDHSIRLAELETFLSSPPGPQLFRDRYVVLATSGSTGRRGIFVFSGQEWIACLASISRPMTWAGVTPSLWRPARAALIAANTAWHYSARVGMSLSNRLLPLRRIDAATPLEEIVQQLNAWRPQILTAYPSVLKQLAEEQLAGRLNIPVRKVSTSAEPLTAPTRARVERAWGVTVRDVYGATEYAPIAAECTEGRLHLFEDGAIIEIVDEQGRAVADGERGERVLVTVLGRRTQPLIRYEITDMLRPVAGQCRCGRPFRMIEAIEGRIEDVLLMPPRGGGGPPVSIHPNLFHDVLGTIRTAGWQVVQEADALVISFVDHQDDSLRAAVASTVSTLLESRGAQAPPVIVRCLEPLQRGPTGKAPLIRARPAAAQRPGGAAPVPGA